MTKDIAGKQNTAINLISYNCKNVLTSAHLIDTLLQNSDFVLLQETWLFQCNQHLLAEVASDVQYAGKGVDFYNPLSPIQLPRGYGGVAILWKSSIDHLVTVLPDGNQRMQCIEVASNESRCLLISLYMPSRGITNCDVEFQECVDLLSEIVEKYQTSHEIIIGGGGFKYRSY